MKMIAFWNRYELLNDRLFTDPNAPIGDNLLLPFNALAQTARERGIKVRILGEDSSEPVDAIVCIDMPMNGALLTASDIPKYLITFEPPVVLPENWQEEKHRPFRKVFTWADDLVMADPGRYVKIHYPQRFPKRVPRNPRGRLACMIASDKDSLHSLSLYGERRSAIRWFEKNSPLDFDLYGPGWNHELTAYRGSIPAGKKIETLSRYQFSICFENARDLPGYITEKITDCFIAGTIPVYLGAPNVTDYIPSECFLDARGMCYSEIYHWMRTPSFYNDTLDAIEAFMKSESARPFTIERFVDTILGAIDF